MRDDTELWRRLANEARAEAEKMSDAGLRATMLRVAGMYDRAAARCACSFGDGLNAG